MPVLLAFGLDIGQTRDNRPDTTAKLTGQIYIFWKQKTLALTCRTNQKVNQHRCLQILCFTEHPPPPLFPFATRDILTPVLSPSKNVHLLFKVGGLL